VQCFTVEVLDGTEVAGKTSTKGKTALVEMNAGTAPFEVTINGITLFETLEPVFEVPVKHGDLIAVKTSVDCEGVYMKRITLFDQVVAYPNPSRGLFELAIPPDISELRLEVYDHVSRRIYSGSRKVENGRILIDLTAHPNGIYLVRLGDSEVHSFKLLKH
jgi:hypothetical protein